MRRRVVDRRRWADGETSSGPVWPPPASSSTGERPQAVRVERHEVVEALGTPEQLVRSGVIGPGWQQAAGNGMAAGGALAGQGGLMQGAFVLAQSIELWLVALVHRLCMLGARFPRLVLWLGAFWLVSRVVS